MLRPDRGPADRWKILMPDGRVVKPVAVVGGDGADMLGG